jgi:hypothetical protein
MIVATRKSHYPQGPSGCQFLNQAGYPRRRLLRVGQKKPARAGFFVCSGNLRKRPCVAGFPQSGFIVRRGVAGRTGRLRMVYRKGPFRMSTALRPFIGRPGGVGGAGRRRRLFGYAYEDYRNAGGHGGEREGPSEFRKGPVPLPSNLGPRPAIPYFIVIIHTTSALMSGSFTCPLGGIGMSPHAPLPPSFTFLIRLASAPLSLRYLSAISL